MVVKTVVFTAVSTADFSTGLNDHLDSRLGGDIYSHLDGRLNICLDLTAV